MDAYLNQHILLSTLKQAFFLQAHGKQAWNYEVASQKLVFARKTAYRAQILGSYAKGSGTWLWSWANTESGLPEAATAYASKLREWAQAKGVAPFTEPEWAVDERRNPELVGLLAIGLLRSRAFFAGHHEHGAVYLVLSAEHAFAPPQMTNLQFINHVTGVISQIPITSHRDAVVGFCNGLGWKGSLAGTRMTIANPHERAAILLDFDGMNRLTGTTTTLGGG